jgi:hypothetical protein
VWETLARLLVELGILGALVGYVSNRWSAKYTADLNAQHARELQLLQSELELTTHVTKAQFEAEHRAVTTIWGHVHEVRSKFLNACIATARPAEDEPSDPKERDEWLRGRVNQLIAARNTLSTAVFSQEPFYSDELRQHFELLLEIVHRETLRLSSPQRFSSEWFDLNDQRRRNFIDVVANIREVIRQHYRHLGIAAD